MIFFFSMHLLVLPKSDIFMLRDGSIRPTLAQEVNRLIRLWRRLSGPQTLQPEPLQSGMGCLLMLWGGCFHSTCNVQFADRQQLQSPQCA